MKTTSTWRHTHSHQALWHIDYSHHNRKVRKAIQVRHTWKLHVFELCLQCFDLSVGHMNCKTSSFKTSEISHGGQHKWVRYCLSATLPAYLIKREPANLRYIWKIAINTRKSTCSAQTSTRRLQWHCDVNQPPAHLPQTHPLASHLPVTAAIGQMLTNTPMNKPTNQQTWRIAIPPYQGNECVHVYQWHSKGDILFSCVCVFVCQRIILWLKGRNGYKGLQCTGGDFTSLMF